MTCRVSLSQDHSAGRSGRWSAVFPPCRSATSGVTFRGGITSSWCRRSVRDYILCTWQNGREEYAVLSPPTPTSANAPPAGAGERAGDDDGGSRNCREEKRVRRLGFCLVSPRRLVPCKNEVALAFVVFPRPFPPVFAGGVVRAIVKKRWAMLLASPSLHRLHSHLDVMWPRHRRRTPN